MVQKRRDVIVERLDGTIFESENLAMQIINACVEFEKRSGCMSHTDS